MFTKLRVTQKLSVGYHNSELVYNMSKIWLWIGEKNLLQ